MYTVSNAYKQAIYSGDARNKIKLYFNEVEYTTAGSKVEYVKRKSNILSQAEERFSLNNFISQELEIKIHDIDLAEIVEPIRVSIGTLVDEQNDTYEYVPLGIFNLSETPTTSDGVTTIKMRDYSTKFDVPYNAEAVIQANNGEVTMLQLLQDICTFCGVTLQTTDFINKTTKISVWDNTINARIYVGYIAEKAGSIATIGRDGKLYLIPINNTDLTTFEIPKTSTGLMLLSKYVEGQRFVISRVVYEDAIRKFEYGSQPTEEEILQLMQYPISDLYPDSEFFPTNADDLILYAKEHTTLYIDTANPYIVDTAEVENVYNSIKDFSIFSLKVENMIGNPALDPYDLIKFEYKGREYTTFAQGTLTFSGNIMQNFNTQIGTLERAQENVTLNSEESRFNRVSTRIDQAEGNIELLTGKVENDIYTIEQTNLLIQNASAGLTNTFTTTGGANIFRNTGLWFRTNDSANPYEYWSGTVLKDSENKAVNRSCLILQDDTLGQEQVVPNGIYTISFVYQKLINLAEVKISINGTEEELTSTDETEYVKTIEVQQEYINIQFISDTDDSCKIYDLMVNVGDVKLAYSQNQNETTTDTVNISKGITIISSDTNTEFKADSDGIRIYEKGASPSTPPKTEFTDKGTNTDELTANQSTVAGLLTQDVEGQTWLTRI